MGRPKLPDPIRFCEYCKERLRRKNPGFIKELCPKELSTKRFCGNACVIKWRHLPETIIARLMKRVLKTPTCWLWQGPVEKHGYAKIGFNKKVIGVHIAAYLLMVGPVPSGFLVCHTCDVKICVRPEHLFKGTDLDNVLDALKKNRLNSPKLTEAEVVEVLSLLSFDVPYKDIAKRFDISPSYVSLISRGRRRVILASDLKAPIVYGAGGA